MSNVPQDGQAGSSAFGGHATQGHNAVAGPSVSRGGVRGGRRGAIGGRGTMVNRSFGNRSAVFNAPSTSSVEASVQSELQSSSKTRTTTSQIGSDVHQPFRSADMTAQESVVAESITTTPAEPEEDRRRRFENLPGQNRFFEMRAQRETLRAKYIQDGILPDPDKPTDLAEAIALKGTCMEMCPEFEREEREFQNEGDVLEMFPGTTRIDPKIAVKIYRRPAAGRELPLPEDVRPPPVLCRTLDYLVHDLLPSDPGSDVFTSVQPFMWNRTRAIRQDFIVQGERGALAIECHERIARYHILCLHWRGGVGAEGWSEQQELEQLRKTIRSLTEFYEDSRRKEGRSSPNEAEFRAYNLLLHMHDPETLREVEGLEFIDAPIVQAALKLRGFAQRSNNVIRRGRPLNTEATMNLWTRFFGELRRNKSVSYLLACLAENVFSSVRAGALKAMGKTYLSQHAPLSLDFLQRSLAMDTEEQTRTFCIELGAEEAFTQTGQLLGLRLVKINDDKPLPLAPFSANIVESKRGRSTSQDVINGKASNAAPLAEHTAVQRSNISSKPLPTKSILPSFTPPVQQIPQPAAQSAFGAVPTLPATSLPTTSKQPTIPSITAAPSFTFKPSTPTTTLPQVTHSSATPTSLSPFASPFVPVANVDEKQSSRTAFSFAPPQQQQQPRPIQTNSINQTVKATEAASLPPDRVASPPESVAAPHSPFTAPKVITAPTPKPSLVSATTPKPSPKRTIESVTRGLSQDLVAEIIRRKVDTIAEQACLREVRIRQKRIREETVKRCVVPLQDAMWEDVLDEVLLQVASESLADEMAMRCTLGQTWRVWRRMLSRAREQAQQTARLHQIRSKVRARTRKMHQNFAQQAHPMELDVRDDDGLRQSLVQAQEGRSDVWKPSTFLWAVVQRMPAILSSSMERWTVGLDIDRVDAPSSTWLKVKFGIDREPHAEVALRSDICVHVMDVGSCFDDFERDLGMLVFELKLSKDLSSVDWEANRQRMLRIVSSNLVRQSRYRPKLLLISWQTIDRKELLSKLQLRATDGMRYNWSEVEVWLAGEAAHENIQVHFERCLEDLLSIPPKLLQTAQISFEDVVNVCTLSWRQAMERMASCMYRLAGAGINSETVLDRVALAFNTATFLVNRAIEDVEAVSELVADENLDRERSALPMPSVKSVADDIDSRLYKLAFSQIEMLHAHHGVRAGSQAQLFKVWLGETRLHAKHFPWLDYFVRLLHIGLLSAQQSFMQATLSSLQEIKLQVEPSTVLYTQAADEFEFTTKPLLQKRTRLASPDVEERWEPVKIRRTSSELGKRKPAIVVKADTPIVKTTDNASLASLRSLVAGAKDLLAQRQEAETLL